MTRSAWIIVLCASVLCAISATLCGVMIWSYQDLSSKYEVLNAKYRESCAEHARSIALLAINPDVLKTLPAYEGLSEKELHEYAKHMAYRLKAESENH